MKSAEQRIEIITDLSKFKDLRLQWDNLYGSAVECYPTVSHAWLVAWWEAFGDNAVLYIILGWRGEDLICGVPFSYRLCQRFGKLRQIVSLFTNSWVDRTTLLVRVGEEQFLEKIVDHLLNVAPRWDCIELDRLDAASDITKRLHILLSEHGLLVGTESSLQSPYLCLPKSWPDMLQIMSKNFRKNVQRKCRKAEKLEGMKLSIRRDAAVINPIMDISLQTWQHDAGTSMASIPQIRKFYEAIINDAASTGVLYAGLMEVQEIPVAFEFNIWCGKILYSFKVGYRKEYAEWSPGTVLKAFVIEHFINDCAMQGDYSVEYDFMGTNEAFKREWSKTVREHVMLIVYAGKWDLWMVHFWKYTLKPGLRRRLPWLGEIKRHLQQPVNKS